MTGDSFHALVADPSRLDAESLTLLQELSARYPYFRAPKLLLAKNLKDLNHIDQRRQLHLAAIYAADRALLLDLMEGKHPKRVAPERTENWEIENGQVEQVVEQPAPPEVEGESEPAVPETEQMAVPEILAEESTEPATPKTIPSAIDLSLIPEPVLYRVEDLLLNEPPHSDPVPTEEPAPEPDALPFDQWLARISSTVAAPQGSGPAIPQPYSTDEPMGRPRPLPKDDFALIADFLAAQPKDGRTQRAEFFKATKAAERSNTIDLTAVSETLANIYEQQGQFELAAKAFEALAAKYPDKSSYFAARKSAALEKGKSQ